MQGLIRPEKANGTLQMRKDRIMRKYQMQICVIAAVALLGTAAFCGFRIYHHYAQREKQTEVFKQMAELVENAPEESPKEDTPVSEGGRCP